MLSSSRPAYEFHVGFLFGRYKVIEMRDHPTEGIIVKFPEARDFIKLALGGGGKILIHGVNGMSRRY